MLLNGLGSDQTPGFANVPGQFVVADGGKLDSDPTAETYVRRFEICRGCAVNEQRLQSWRRGQPDGDMAVVVMIIREHGVDFFADEEGWFAVREFFGGFRETHADAADAAQVVFAVVDLYSGNSRWLRTASACHK